MRVDFYVLNAADERGRARLACRLVEKAYGAGQRVLVWLQNPAELTDFDELLWTFADRSFVPHEPYSDARQWQDTPVLLSCPAGPTAPAGPTDIAGSAASAAPLDLLLNLAEEVPPQAAMAARLIEVIDSDPARLQSGRHRFRHYREQGHNPQTHHIAVDEGL